MRLFQSMRLNPSCAKNQWPVLFIASKFSPIFNFAIYAHYHYQKYMLQTFHWGENIAKFSPMTCFGEISVHMVYRFL